MRVVKSFQNKVDLTIHDACETDGGVSVTVAGGMFYVNTVFARLELIDALGGVPVVELQQAQQKLDECDIERGRMHAKAIELEAIVSAVRDALDEHPDPCTEAGEYTTCGWKRAFQHVHSIVNPEPPFDLPTKPGAGIIANYEGEEIELRLFSDGAWLDQLNGCDWLPAQVLSEWTDHRLIGGD